LCLIGLALGRSLENKPKLLRVAAATLIFGAGLLANAPALNSAVIRLLE
jgi:hypothetical protein